LAEGGEALNRLSHTQIYAGEYSDIYDGFTAVVQHARHVYAILSVRDFVKSARHCLSIGPGKGRLELMLLEGFPYMRMAVVEPSEPFVEAFTAAADESGVLARVTETATTKFEKTEFEQKFDCILSVHSWYGIGNNRETLDKALELLQPGGTMFITAVDAANAAWLKRCGIPRYEWNTDAFSAWLTEVGVEHKVETETRLIARSTILNGDSFTEPGKCYLAFQTLLPFELIPDETKRSFRSALNEDVLKLTFGCITVTKPAS
jgi:SAM-dependent methyltransferase